MLPYTFSADGMCAHVPDERGSCLQNGFKIVIECISKGIIREIAARCYFAIPGNENAPLYIDAG